jgi:hypothetical protein
MRTGVSHLDQIASPQPGDLFGVITPNGQIRTENDRDFLGKGASKGPSMIFFGVT